MNNTTYNISGSLNDIYNILELEFGFQNEKDAKIAALVLGPEISNDSMCGEISLWTNNKEYKYTTPFFLTRYNVNFTALGIGMLKSIAEGFVLYCLFDEITSIPAFVWSSLKELWYSVQNISKIDNENGTGICCTYFMAIKWKLQKGNILKRFMLSDITSQFKDEYCLFLDRSRPCEIKKDELTGWECMQRNGEKCRARCNNTCDEFVKSNLNTLCECRILNEINDTYDFVI